MGLDEAKLHDKDRARQVEMIQIDNVFGRHFSLGSIHHSPDTFIHNLFCITYQSKITGKAL